MKKKFNELSQRRFIRNVAIMATGTAAAQAVAMGLTPFITRIYGPSAFGIMGVFTSIVGIFATISALTYPAAIVIAKSSRDVSALIKLSLNVTLFISIFTTFLLLVMSDYIVSIFSLKALEPFLYLIPIVILFSGILEIIENWLIRNKQFKVKAKMTFFQSLILNGSKVGIGLLYPVSSVLIFTSALNNGLKALMLWVGITKINKSNLWEFIQRKSTPQKEIAILHKDFPLYRAPQVLINGISHSVPVLLLASFFGPTAVGFFTVGKNVMNLPAQLIGKAVADVYYPRVTEAAKNKENLTKLIVKATLSLAAIGVIPFGTVMLIGPWLFEIVFGEDWTRAGIYGRWIALWTFCMFINLPSIKAFPIINAQGFHLKFTIISLGIPICALIVGNYMFNSDVISVALFCITSGVMNIILILLTLRMTNRFDKK